MRRVDGGLQMGSMLGTEKGQEFPLSRERQTERGRHREERHNLMDNLLPASMVDLAGPGPVDHQHWLLRLRLSRFYIYVPMLRNWVTRPPTSEEPQRPHQRGDNRPGSKRNSYCHSVYGSLP